jgi:hypothetical protein
VTADEGNRKTAAVALLFSLPKKLTVNWGWLNSFIYFRSRLQETSSLGLFTISSLEVVVVVPPVQLKFIDAPKNKDFLNHLYRELLGSVRLCDKKLFFTRELEEPRKVYILLGSCYFFQRAICITFFCNRSMVLSNIHYETMVV